MNATVIATIVAALAGAVVGSLLTFGLTIVAARIGERRRIQRDVFNTMVRYRGQILHSDVVAAINMIDIVFIDAKEVREARQQFMESINKPATLELRRERFLKIIEAIARYMNTARKLTAKDIENSYHPEFIGKSVDVALYETHQKWTQIPPEWWGNAPVPTVTPDKPVSPLGGL